ncbi:MAG: NADAR family protein [Isosphaeraceae bacterium]
MAATTGGDPEGDAVSDVIRFYAVGDEYGCFSNFSSHPVKLQGKIWPMSEHYFQAQKFAGTPDEEEVRLAKSPMIAALMGRSRKRPLRKDWESVKDSIMHGAVLAKFTQHADFARDLARHRECHDRRTHREGPLLGRRRRQRREPAGPILMQVREELRYGDTQGDNPAEAGL